jgi:hypothetical protein
MPAEIPAVLIHPYPSAAGHHPSGLTGGWLGDYLRDPGGALLALLARLRDWAITWGPIVTLVLALVQ